MDEFSWSVRIRASSNRTVTIYARNLAIRCGDPVSFRPTDSDPTSLELLLGGFAADILGTYRSVARRRRVVLDTIEMSANCMLHDPLAHIGVVGEDGDPSLKSISGVLYVSSDAETEALQAVWNETLLRSPIYRTLSRATDVTVRIHITI